jgi:hypothetical protein
LSYTMLRDYLKFLRDNDLLEESHYPDQKVTLYKTTAKGLRFLDSYLELKDLAAPLADKKPFVASSDLAEAFPSTSRPDADHILR